MQAMLPTELADFDVIATNGYYVAGDGGEGRYRYLSTATDTVDGGSVIAPTSGIGRFFLLVDDVFNVKQFGAKGDGTAQWFLFNGVAPAGPNTTPTDDTAAIQAAINFASSSGWEMFVPEGYYRVTAPLTISKGWGITMRGRPFTYLARTAATNRERFLRSTFVRDFNGVMLTVRGRNLATDSDANDYDTSTGNRHAGTLIENMGFAAKTLNTSTATLWKVQRLARCNFRNVVTHNALGIGTEIFSGDDSQFFRCYWYTLGFNNFITGFPAVVVHRRTLATVSQDAFVETNTLHFLNCDWENNPFGNFAVSRDVTETQSIVGLYFIGGLGKTVSVYTDGVVPFDLFHIDTVRIDLDACNMTSAGLNFTGTGGHAHTATEILKIDNCANVYGTLFMQQTGTGAQWLTINRYVTIVGSSAVDLRLSIFSNYLPSEEYCVNVATSTQVRVQGTMRLPVTESGQKMSNVSPDQIAAVSSVLLGEIIAADFNPVVAGNGTDQPLVIRATRYRIRYILADNQSVSMTTAQGGIYTAVNRGGTAVVAAGQSYAGLTGVANTNIDLTLADTGIRTESSLYFNLSVAQGAAATANIRVYGDILQ
jgi:hypothetical protein